MMMMQPEILLQSASSSFHEDISSVFDPFEVHSSTPPSSSTFFSQHHHSQYPFDMGSESSKSIEKSSVNESQAPSIFFSEDLLQFPVGEDDILELPSLPEDFSMDLDAFDSILNTQFPGIHGFPEESEGSFHFLPSELQNLSSETELVWSPTPTMKSSECSTVQQQSLRLPQEDMEIETQLILPHLLEAYGEARDQKQNALAEEILRCTSQKASPLGEEPLERLAFHHSSQNIIENPHGHFLKQEACKNFDLAFKAFYQGLPYGKFAHFAANSAILEAIPEDSEVVHIMDFDMGEGVQWASMIEAISQQNRTLKLTSIQWEGEELKSVESRKNLIEHARCYGVKLKIEEKGFEDLVTELKKLNKRRDFLVFNCMVGLPHMGRRRSRRSVMEFLILAKNIMDKNTCNRGIITFGDGEAIEKLRNSSNFTSFFEGNLMHYKALLESIEAKFPGGFSEARTAMEFLFVAPYVSSVAWLKKWEELEENWDLVSEMGLGLEGRRMSKRSLMEVREMLRGRSESSHEAKIEGQNGNEMVLEWKGTQLVRVSIWEN